MRLFDPGTDEKMPRTHLVFGAYDGEIDAADDEKVVFIGDCATFSGDIDGEPVTIENVYVDRSHKNPLEAKGTDIYAKIASVERDWFRMRNDRILEIRGCPVSVAEQVLLLVKLGKLKSPYFDRSQTIPFTNCYLSSRTQRALRALRRESYNIVGAADRGDAAVP
jgi:hypothetical protein